MDSIELYASEAAEDGIKTAFQVPIFPGDRNERLISIFIDGAATVTIHGQLRGGTQEWISIVTGVTASALIPIAFVPWLRVTVSGASNSPTVAVRVSQQ